MKAFSRIVHRHLDERGWSIKTLAATLAPKNPEVNLRKITELLSGEVVRLGLIDAICVTLNIEPSERKAALAEDQMSRRKEIEAYQRARFSPHLWIETRPGWFPNLVTFIGVDFFRKVKVGEVLPSLKTDEEIIGVAGELVAQHFKSPELKVSKDELASYLYRRSFDLAYRFTADGKFIEKVVGPYVAPMTAIRIR